MAPSRTIQWGGVCLLRPVTSDINLFCYRECDVDPDPQISDGALDLRVAQLDLYSAQVDRAPVDRGCLCSAR